ncbi:MAG TPA: hypothetical protein VFT84_12375 [Gemmatimonadales bacterium]|nr:hypothetical protein [Gemmatimonadales bacterium]
MTARPGRTSLPQEWEPVRHELAPLRILESTVEVELTVRHAPDGAWRGHLRFVTPEGAERITAEIFRADSEAELWHSVRTLGEHYLRALFHSLA